MRCAAVDSLRPHLVQNDGDAGSSESKGSLATRETAADDMDWRHKPASNKARRLRQAAIRRRTCAGRQELSSLRSDLTPPFGIDRDGFLYERARVRGRRPRKRRAVWGAGPRAFCRVRPSRAAQVLAFSFRGRLLENGRRTSPTARGFPLAQETPAARARRAFSNAPMSGTTPGSVKRPCARTRRR